MEDEQVQILSVINSDALEEAKISNINEILENSPQLNLNFGDDTESPLHAATNKKELGVIKLLLQNGAHPNFKNCEGNSPLDIAERDDIVHILKSYNTTISRLNKFVHYFASIYEKYLSEYTNRLEKRTGKPGAWADFTKKAITVVFGASKLVAPDITSIPIKFLKKGIDKVGSSHNMKETIKLFNQLNVFRNEPTKVKEELIKAGVEIFVNFEQQLVEVAENENWEQVIQKLAYDAVNRVINFYRTTTGQEFSTRAITMGIVLGKSKKSKINFIPAKSKYCSFQETIDNAGLVVHDECYDKLKGNSKYGYRLCFKWEEDELKKNLTKDYQKADKTVSWNYILRSNKKLMELLEKQLLFAINNTDTMEDRLKECFEEELEEIKQEVDENFHEMEMFIKDNFDGLLHFVEENKSDIKEIFIQVKQQHKEATLQRQCIDQKLDRLLSLTKIKRTRKPSCYEIEDSEEKFIGRKEQTDKIKSTIKSKIVLVYGLPGVGKSALAQHFASNNYDSQADSVIWINPKNAKDKFNSLYTKLCRSKIEEGKSIQSIVQDVYDYFVEEKILFIFDDFESYTSVEDFLPLPNHAKKPHILITSNSEWKTSKRLEGLPLHELSEEEAISFVKNRLVINDNCQDEEIKDLVNILHNFPFSLHTAVEHIKEKCELLTNVSLKQYKVNDYLADYGKNKDILLKPTCKILQESINNIKNNEDGQQALEITNIMAFLNRKNVPINMFLDMPNIDEIKQGSIFKLLRQHSIVRYDNKIWSMHGLVQEVVKLQLTKQPQKEEDILRKTLDLLTKHMLTYNSAEMLEKINGLLNKHKGDCKSLTGLEKMCELLGKHKKDCMSAEIHRAQMYLHCVRSIWSRAKEYDNLIKCFIVDKIYSSDIYTTYFHLIVENCTYEDVVSVIIKIDQNELDKVLNAKNTHNETPLHISVKSGKKEILIKLIKKGADINIAEENGWTALHLAVKNNNLEIVKQLLYKKCEILKTNDGDTPLHLAVKNGSLEIVKTLLLLKTIDVNAKNKENNTPLHLAAKSGNEGVVEVLLGRYASAHTKSNGKFTPLHLAARFANVNVVKLLMEKSNVNAETGKEFTPLHFASQSNSLEIINTLIHQQNGDACIKTSQEIVKSYLEIRKKKLEIVKLLVAEKRTIVNTKTTYKYSPLHLAVQSEALDLKNMLLKINEDNCSANQFRELETCFEEAYSAKTELIKELIKAGADVNEETGKELTPILLFSKDIRLNKLKIDGKMSQTENNPQIGTLPQTETTSQTKITPPNKISHQTDAFYAATKKHYVDIINVLIESGANVNVKNKENFTALHWAVLYDAVDVVKMLIDHGATINARTTHQKTPLHFGTELGLLDIVKVIIEKHESIKAEKEEQGTIKAKEETQTNNQKDDKIDGNVIEDDYINFRDNDHHTPLHRAVKSGNVEVVDLLVKHGAHMDVKTRKGKTILDLAENEVMRRYLNDKQMSNSVRLE